VPSCSPWNGETSLCRKPLTFSCLGAASAASLPWLVWRPLAENIVVSLCPEGRTGGAGMFVSRWGMTRWSPLSDFSGWCA
ncbi:MAG: hypothetical protein J5548_11810, partial [Prevotella sp.]|nr:hypothetical protein [Prevotella sp.]